MPRRRRAVLTVREKEALPRGVSFRATNTTPRSSRKTVDKEQVDCAQQRRLFNWSSLRAGSVHRKAFDTRIRLPFGTFGTETLLMLQDVVLTFEDVLWSRLFPARAETRRHVLAKCFVQTCATLVEPERNAMVSARAVSRDRFPTDSE